MIKNNTLKGYLFVVVSVLAMANVYIFSKASLNIVNLSQFGVWWFGFAIIYNFTLNYKNVNFKKFRSVKKENIKLIIIIGLLELIGTSAFFIAIKTMTNPALVSFFANSTPVFVSILGILILKERFNKIEIIGIFSAIVGSFIIAYNPGQEIPGDFYKSLILIIISSFSFSISTILSKKNIKDIPPSVLTINRTFFLFVASLIYLLISGSSLLIPSEAVINISLGSLLGPFLAAYAGYSALNYIEASRSSVLGSSKSMFVLITAFLYFNILPSNFQLIGGLFTIAGVLLISFGKFFKSKKIIFVK